jgi:hypothetical protein
MALKAYRPFGGGVRHYVVPLARWPLMSADLLVPHTALATDHVGLDAHQQYIAAARSLYALNVMWVAPARNLAWQGRETVIRQLLREASGMEDPEFTPLRRSRTEHKLIDEFAVRFVYAGEGIDSAPIMRGDFVELKRVRLLDLYRERCVQETCIETWTVLLPE